MISIVCGLARKHSFYGQMEDGLEKEISVILTRKEREGGRKRDRIEQEEGREEEDQDGGGRKRCGRHGISRRFS